MMLMDCCKLYWQVCPYKKLAGQNRLLTTCWKVEPFRIAGNHPQQSVWKSLVVQRNKSEGGVTQQLRFGVDKVQYGRKEDTRWHR